jgi:hypothetical protein
LFRRAQVRQILAYQRGRALDDYLVNLRAVLSDEHVRFHLKKLVLQWLRQLDDPSDAEWEIVASLWSDARIGKHVRTVPHDSVGWFDLLDSLGVWQRWLDSSDAADIDHAIWLLRMPTVLQARSSRVAALLAPYRTTGGKWRERLQNVVGFGDCYHSREMFDLLLSLLGEGSLDASFRWSSLHDMPKQKPEWAAELIAHHLDHLQEISLRLDLDNPFAEGTNVGHLAADFLSATAEKSPETFVYYLLPRVAYLVCRTEQHEHGKVHDRIWNFKVFGRHEYDTKDALLGSLQRAMVALAKQSPAILDRLVDGIDALPHETVAFLLESAWAANGGYYADRAAKFLLADSRRLEVGYSMWASGSGQEAVSCALLTAITPHCSDGLYSRLEESIVHRNTTWERELPKSIGITEFHLLNSLAAERLTGSARLRLDELRRKFPSVKTEPPQPLHVVSVESPIPPSAFERMTDEQWLAAMAEYAGEKSGSPREFMKGNVHQLAGELEVEAKKNKERFSALALKMGDDVHRRYFSAILSGIVTEDDVTRGNHAQHSIPEQRQVAIAPPLGTAKIIEVMNRVHQLPHKPCGKAICRAVSQIAGRKLPDEVLEIVSYYATQDPDPASELWREAAVGGTPYYGGSPAGHGINTVRGAAASALGQLLFGDGVRFEKLERAIVSLVNDQSFAVRACAAEALLPVLNVNRDRAISLFLDLCRDAEPILGSHTIDTFLHYATFRHYAHVRELLRKMLISEDSAARQIAARQISVASFHDSDAADDLDLIAPAGADARAAATQVFAANLTVSKASDVCRRFLRAAFADESKAVREAATTCFRQISATQLSEETELIEAFITSPAFADGVNDLLFALEDSTAQLPEVICRLPERVIELYHLSGSKQPIDANWWTHMMPPLVLRLYEQCKDAKTQARCLNLIDGMIDLDFGSIQTELVKVER